jgi:hypothetical protein
VATTVAAAKTGLAAQLGIPTANIDISIRF